MGCHGHWCWGIPLNSCVIGIAGTWFVWVASVAGAAGVSCTCLSGGGNAGHATEKQCQLRACSVAVVPLGTVSTAFDTTFMKVSPCVAVCGTIAGVYLIAVLW